MEELLRIILDIRYSNVGLALMAAALAGGLACAWVGRYVCAALLMLVCAVLFVAGVVDANSTTMGMF